MESKFTSQAQRQQRSELFAGEEPVAGEDGLSADEKTQLRELCVLIVISEFLETAGNQSSIADSQGNQE